MKEYDLLVIGAGSGGLVAATSAHRKGLKTALLEKNKIGGECTHYGCVPSKAFINAAKAYHSLSGMDQLGIEVKAPPVNFSKIMERVDHIVQGIYAHETPDVFQDMGIDTMVDESGAVFLDSQTVSIGNELLRAKHIIISTGSSPAIPAIPGIEKVHLLHNETFWELRTFPQKIVFIGGGVISVELGQSLARLGCEVWIIERNDRILKVTEPETGNYLSKILQQEGVKLVVNAEIKTFVDKDTVVYMEGGEQHSISADFFFLATGRMPHVRGMNLEAAGVEYTDRGIYTNEFLQTTVPHIYACGDVTTPYKFTHTASHQANICVDNILNPTTRTNDLSVLPWAIFTEPEIGHVGITEKEAIKTYGKENIHIYSVEAAIDRFITDRKTGGLLKVIFDANDYVLGAEAVGAHAGEWIQLLTLVIKNRLPASQMADTIFAYPSYSEIVKKLFSRYLRSKHHAPTS